MKSDVVVDCVGLYCPIPIANLAKKMKELKVGQVIELLADDQGIRADMPAWCKMTGNELLGINEEDAIYHVFVRKAKD